MQTSPQSSCGNRSSNLPLTPPPPPSPSSSLFVCLFVCLALFLLSCLSVCSSVCLSRPVSACLFVCLALFLSVCLFVCLSVCLCFCLPVCLSLSPPVSVCVSISASYRLVGLEVKASASRVKDMGFDSRLRRDLSGSSHTSDLKIGTPVATLPGAWRYRVSAGTGRPGVSMLGLGEMESLMCNISYSVVAG